MSIRTQEHYEALRNLIGYIGMTEVLEALSEIAQSHADVQSNTGQSVGASKLLAAELSNLAARYAYERGFEIHSRSQGGED
ncbi:MULTISPECIES: hypothetical protein [Leptolyngbya]|nr:MULTISPECIES: hypothetical protein [Leptolyngbya]MBD2401511.1 hypothetical protein [Leptolyngbya sp. FACHB-239]MBD2370779.1 hypothetical protein [Leptolyngbya sp. FACHB-161]MBD2377068.1 hypothetical protein [Leptolyngbya sp. FACHB-238]MBD2408063.1 hypothetical protein [Leptolyngbya sp. FACHB-402]ULP29611.1 hypothetical protein MCP04_26875 [Leptolyngbya boryana IU 594]